MDKPYPGVEGVLDLWIHQKRIDHTHKDALLSEVTDDIEKFRRWIDKALDVDAAKTIEIATLKQKLSETVLQNAELRDLLECELCDAKIEKGGLSVVCNLCWNKMALQNKELRDVLEIAKDRLYGDGCDCGTDEPGSCALCMIEAALKGTDKPKARRLLGYGPVTEKTKCNHEWFTSNPILGGGDFCMKCDDPRPKTGVTTISECQAGGVHISCDCEAHRKLPQETCPRCGAVPLKRNQEGA